MALVSWWGWRLLIVDDDGVTELLWQQRFELAVVFSQQREVVGSSFRLFESRVGAL